jgi:hypothetical protein
MWRSWKLPMSKICDRNYKANQAYTVKMINGIGCCPLCEKPTICHNKPVEQRALFWALSGDTGSSSEAIARHMTGNNQNSFAGPPSDSSDRGRCIRLLELIPEWIARLGEMQQYDNTKQPTGITISGSGITADRNT